jgi:uncharacterized protein (UPF0147 family)
MDSQAVVLSAEAIMQEENMPKQILSAIERIIQILKNSEDVHAKKDKCIHELEEIEANGSVEPGIRVLLLDLASALEQMN